MSAYRGNRPVMARRIQAHRRTPPAALALAGLAAVVLAVVSLAAVLGGNRPSVAQGPSPSGPAPVANLPSARPSPQPGRSATPSAPQSEAPTTRPTAPPSARPSPAETATARRSFAPGSAQEFDLAGQVIEIGFPIRPEVEYRYRDNWLDRRDGPADDYNHARQADDGRLLRLHDGIDIYGPVGAPIIAPFAGRVIDPKERWTPWETDRYGLTVVIESTEPQSEGYVAMLVHLEHVWVDIGQRVSRGQVIGVLGRTGNTEGTSVRAHLHFELRAPFEIDWTPIGERRRVDAFNPYPSLLRADPHS